MRLCSNLVGISLHAKRTMRREQLDILFYFFLPKVTLLSEDKLGARQTFLEHADDRDEHFTGDAVVELCEVFQVHVLLLSRKDSGDELVDLSLV